MKRIIGIDLGTTNSVEAFMDEAGPRLVPNVLGETLTPSVIGLEADGKIVVGREAKELQVLQPERCACLFKRHMGGESTFTLAGRTFTPEELSSLVLRSLKGDAEAFLHESIGRAVVTVPAYFNDQHRKATLAALVAASTTLTAVPRQGEGIATHAGRVPPVISQAFVLG